ncbi:rhomboid family protein [Tritrichomonas foetus]|uniref:Rhomboid family protein n=1 Tax=Tritrichomonas foetus TaxID=1144522 RepID=A0A1J4K2B8_9EUKA|nr:rhomboid family protein [Tritrichomonas foetus]|eukprot:OHT03637.1 rhomboid family protein [Tritrichomonas foetus]
MMHQIHQHFSFFSVMGYHPPVLDLLDFPFTVLIIIINVYICYFLNTRNIPIESVAISATTYLDRKEYWRGVTASFSHYSLLHIIFNISSAWELRTLEKFIGIITFLKYITLLVIFPPLLDSLIRKRFFPDRIPWAVGYSCVLCGLSAYTSLMFSYYTIFGIQIPWSIMPFIQIIITQLLVPQASLIGHLSGVLTGYAISWHLFDWFTNKLFLNTLPWIVLFYIHFYKRSHRDSFQWYEYSHDAPVNLVIQGGVLRRT